MTPALMQKIRSIEANLPRPMPDKFFVPTKEVHETGPSGKIRVLITGELGHFQLSFVKSRDDAENTRNLHLLRMSFWQALEMERLEHRKAA